MGIFLETEIAAVMYFCGERVKRLSKYLFGENQSQQKQKYLDACERNYCEGINKGIEEGLCRLLHADSAEKGLKKFAGKFPELHIDLDAELFEKNLILKIAAHRHEILRIIDEGSNQNKREGR